MRPMHPLPENIQALYKYTTAFPPLLQNLLPQKENNTIPYWSPDYSPLRYSMRPKPSLAEFDPPMQIVQWPADVLQEDRPLSPIASNVATHPVFCNPCLPLFSVSHYPLSAVRNPLSVPHIPWSTKYLTHGSRFTANGQRPTDSGQSDDGPSRTRPSTTFCKYCPYGLFPYAFALSAKAALSIQPFAYAISSGMEI